MRRFVLLVLAAALPLAARALDRPELDRLLARAAAAQATNYLAARADLLAPGTNALPLLAAAAVDAGLDWRQRLVARICYERIVRGADIRALLEHEWESYPPFHPEPGKFTHVLGPSTEMGEHVIPTCGEAGLWYYYLELTWKSTGEVPHLKRRRDQRFESVWPYWCREAVKNVPEAHFVPRILSDVLDAAAFAKRDDVDLFRQLLELKSPFAVPVLVRRFEAYNERAAPKTELFLGRRAQISRSMFAPILDFADERHVALLEAYIAEHPALAELKPKLAEVRARAAPAPVPEPPFRLGSTPVPAP